MPLLKFALILVRISLTSSTNLLSGKSLQDYMLVDIVMRWEVGRVLVGLHLLISIRISFSC